MIDLKEEIKGQIERLENLVKNKDPKNFLLVRIINKTCKYYVVSRKEYQDKTHEEKVHTTSLLFRSAESKESAERTMRVISYVKEKGILVPERTKIWEILGYPIFYTIYEPNLPNLTS